MRCKSLTRFCLRSDALCTACHRYICAGAPLRQRMHALLSPRPCACSCDRVTDHGVAYVVRGCKSLQTLDVNGAVLLSDLSLLVRARGMCNCDQSSNRVIYCARLLQAICEAKLIPGLLNLDLGSCSRVSDTGVAWLSERQTTLSQVGGSRLWV
jgi:hypothetical protein